MLNFNSVGSAKPERVTFDARFAVIEYFKLRETHLRGHAIDLLDIE